MHLRTKINMVAILCVPAVLGASLNSQTALAEAWKTLKNRVFGGLVTITLPLPDSKGNVDLSVDVSTLDSTQVSEYHAPCIKIPPLSLSIPLSSPPRWPSG